MIAGFYSRYSKYILLAIALSVPVLLVGSIRAVRSNNNQVEDWLPASFHETRQLAWFREHFAADQFVIISWPGCRLGDPTASGDESKDDPRIELLAKKLVPDSIDEDIFLGSSKTTTSSKYFKSVTTGRRVLDVLLKPPASIPYDKAIGRLQGALIGPDSRQTCVVVTLTREATKHLRDAVGHGHPGGPIRIPRAPGELFNIFEECGIDPATVRLGGPPIDNVSIDEEGEKTLVRLAGLSMLFGVCLAWFSLRSVRLTSVVFANGILSAMLAMSIVWYTGTKMDAVLMSMPLLVYVLAVSGAVHIVNYYREAIRDGETSTAADRGIRHAWRPALLCSITTAVGLGSLCTSDLEPVRKFGLYSALGVIGLLLVTFIYLPAALQIFDKRADNSRPARTSNRRRKDRQSVEPIPAIVSLAVEPHAEIADDAWTHRHGKTRMERLWSWCAIFLIRRQWQVSFVCAVVIIGLSLGLSRVQTSIDLLKLFEPKARIIQDYTWFEKNIGPLVPLEIVIRFPTKVQNETNNAPSDRYKIDDVVLASPDQLAAESELAKFKSASTLNFLERCELVALCQEMIERKHGSGGRDLVGKSMSPVTFASELPPTKNDISTIAQRSGTSDVLWKHRDGFVNSGFLRIDPTDQSELWRISMRVRAFAGVDFGAFLHETQGTIQPVILAHECRVNVLQQIRNRQSAENGNSAGAVTVWFSSPDGHEKSLPEPQRFFLGSLFQLLTRNGVKVKLRDLATELDSDPKPETFEVQVVLDALTPTQREKIAERSSVVINVPLENQVGHSLAPESDDPNSPDPLVQDQIRAIYTGVVPIVYKSQRKLLEGLISSTVWSFLTITPLMMFVCRGIWAGLVVMIPNTLPVLVVFGGMGWMGAKVDIGSMMAASIALGVAVDDTIHFMTWFRQSLHVTRSRRRAIIMSYRHCASPTTQSALISGLGLSVFTLSSFTPTQRLGYLMLTILFAGVIAELFMLPAILAGPLGRVFRSKKSRIEEPQIKIAENPGVETPRPKMLSRRERTVAS